MPLRALLYRRPSEPPAISVTFDREIYLVRVRRHRQARRYTLRIQSATREVVLTMPPRGSLKQAHEFAQKHGGWIAARLGKLPEPAPFSPGAVIPLRGVDHRIVHRRGARGTVWIETGDNGEPLLCVAGGGYVAAWIARCAPVGHAGVMGGPELPFTVGAMVQLGQTGRLAAWLPGILLMIPGRDWRGHSRATDRWCYRGEPVMARNKTKQTTISPASFIATVTNAQQRTDSKELIAMMREITGEPPKMWGPSIVGFGTCHYVYESGREDDICLVGFAPRKPSLALYIGKALQDTSLMSRLGKYKTGRGCLYIQKFDDVDRNVLRDLIAKAVDITRCR